ncbi:hypothetical protein J437_LFUL006210 [Ladona fulva]|uniref:Solute carrier organic anion transporter family member n=1 Tax=Ladona fulva TaxID=123851 RepID=A0A8K0NZH2_LADFU|nr:hypothetical protein J437_LFUL006210 [Ladona fulva]
MALGKPRADKPMINKGWRKVPAKDTEMTSKEKSEDIDEDTQCGVISVGNDISQLVFCLFLTYYAGKGHRPRWIAFGIFSVVVFCVLTALPHAVYGPGEDALSLTEEHGHQSTNGTDEDMANLPWWFKKPRILCDKSGKDTTDRECKEGGDELGTGMAPAALLFTAQLISGIGGAIYYPLGVAYMDDNIKKSKTPALVSMSYFLRMLGPASGYALASFCLKLYISPTLTPTINTSNPRWLGAWWLGWVILAIPLAAFAFLMAMFPKTLPRAAERKRIALLKLKTSASKAELEKTKENGEAKAEAENLMKGEEKKDDTKAVEEIVVEEEMPPASLKDMIKTSMRLLRNRIFMMNNIAAIFYFVGYMPYWIFMPKYIETQYRQSASTSSLITGTVGLVFSAIGVLASGIIISRLRPSARALALWNVFCGAVSAAGIISYAFLGCPAVDENLLPSGELRTEFECNSNCACDYVKYSPVCSAADGTTTFISPCHAGCVIEIPTPDGTHKKIYGDCSCVPRSNYSFVDSNVIIEGTQSEWKGGMVTAGACSVDCSAKFYIFLAVVCLLKFVGSTGRASNFLVTVRCVDEKDKAFSMGLGLAMMSLFSFIPSPILFGFIIDKTCLVWGRTCTGTGNCWLYNGASLRYIMNFTAAVFVTIGTMFDGGVWYYAKNLKIFDDKEEEEEEEGEVPVELREVARATGGEA